MKEAAFWPGWSVWGRWRGVARRQPGGGGAESARLHREFQRCFRGHAGESLAASRFQTGWQRGPCRARVLDNAVFMFSVVTMGKVRIDGFHGDYLKISFLKVRRCCRLRGCSQCRRGLPRGRAEGSSDRSRIQTNLPPARTLSRGWGRPTLCPSFLLGSHSPGLHSTAHSRHPRAAAITTIIIIIARAKNVVPWKFSS